MNITEVEWEKLSPEERVIHYNRNLSVGCTHKANLHDWPVDMRESYSFDPYAHTVHTILHSISEMCECNNCVHDMGIERGSPLEYKKRRMRIKYD